MQILTTLYKFLQIYQTFVKFLLFFFDNLPPTSVLEPEFHHYPWWHIPKTVFSLRSDQNSTKKNIFLESSDDKQSKKPPSSLVLSGHTLIREIRCFYRVVVYASARTSSKVSNFFDWHTFRALVRAEMRVFSELDSTLATTPWSLCVRVGCGD